MARHEREARYGRFTGGPDPLAPPLDLSEALDAVSEGVMAGYSPEQSMREFLRRGGRGQAGLDELAGRVQRRRRELLERHHLGGTLEEVAALLERALTAERGQLARDTRMDPMDRTLREMTIDTLPASPAAAVGELSDYDWASPEARDAYRRIQDLLGAEALDARFAGMKQALENATDADRAASASISSSMFSGRSGNASACASMKRRKSSGVSSPRECLSSSSVRSVSISDTAARSASVAFSRACFIPANRASRASAPSRSWIRR